MYRFTAFLYITNYKGIGEMITNKVRVTFFLEEGCKQEDEEVQIEWTPINFSIYSNLFPDLIYEAAWEWLNEVKLTPNILHEVLFAHVVEHDGRDRDWETNCCR